ncbi:uncharacterized protein LOC135700996 [Ochlerotatus camptorhynchus]|uniref:uncharacterized protein LOC135700996 n=1 Tax=Ochlerotatus camptorhynchus TaxID=644619 RepID=UPI0031D99F61
MSSKLSKVLRISLEDYIAKKGIVASPLPKPADSSEPAYFKRPIGSEMEIDDDENDNETKDTSVKVERIYDVVQVPTKKNSNPECRNFNSNEKKNGIHMRSSQENQISKKLTGASPLMTVKSVFDRNTEQLIGSLNENANFRNVDARNRINQRLMNNQGQRQKNNNYYSHQNKNKWNNTYRNQYGKNPNMMASFNPSFQRFSQRSSVPMNKRQIIDLRQCIEPSSSLQSQGTTGPLISNGPWRPPTQFAQPQLVTFADMLTQIGQTADNQNREMFANIIRNVMHNQHQQEPSAAMVPMMTAKNVSQMNSTELMPIAAQTLLNHITTVQQNFGPKYDMKLQKEIHTLQNKSLLYRSNGVVSIDGPGIGGEQVKPVTTDISMNMRFS